MDIDRLRVGPSEIKVPWLDPYKMMSALAARDQLHLLHGSCDLLEWWRRFAKACPNHWAFQQAMAGKLNLARTIPIFSHGDEGRSKRKKGILIWSMRGCVGEGTQLFFDTHDANARTQRMGLNMGGSLRSRFLHVAVPKSVYGKVAEPVWDDIGFAIATSYRRLSSEGFWCNGQQWHAVCVGLTGDT